MEYFFSYVFKYHDANAQETGETLEAFHAALTAQAAKAELGTLEDELVRDLFKSKMKNVVFQDTLTFETFSPGEVLKRAMKFEQTLMYPGIPHFSFSI